jgi:hypothetical protein
MRSVAMGWRLCRSARALLDARGIVAIGTAAPAAPLSVVGGAIFNFNRYGGYNQVTIRGYHSNQNYGVFDFSAQNDAAIPADVNFAEMVGVIGSHIAGAESGSFAFGTKNNGTMSEVMRIGNTGNVGIVPALPPL